MLITSRVNRSRPLRKPERISEETCARTFGSPFITVAAPEELFREGHRSSVLPWLVGEVEPSVPYICHGSAGMYVD